MIANGTKTATPFNIGIGRQWAGSATGLPSGSPLVSLLLRSSTRSRRVSGAHINPAVTIALFATKRFPAGDAAAYIIAQCTGAAIGSLLFFLTVGMDAVTIGGLGATAPFPGIR